MASLSFPAGWTPDADGKKVGVSVRTKDFLSALRLFQRVGEIAEEMEHHPDLHLEEWNRVRIVTWSHDAGGLTDRDERLARALHHILQDEGLVPDGPG